MPRALLCLLASLPLLASGCGAEPPAAAGTPSGAANNNPADFQPGTCGKVTGLVTWVGPVPTVPPLTVIHPRPDGTGYDTRTLTPPNAPRIDTFTRAVGGAVVFLRGVKPERAKPWDLPPVSVEIRDSQILVKQGDRAPAGPGSCAAARR